MEDTIRVIGGKTDDDVMGDFPLVSGSFARWKAGADDAEICMSYISNITSSLLSLAALPDENETYET
jgi:hypothetical protein